MNLLPYKYSRNNVPQKILEAVRPYELKFKLQFSDFYHFTKKALDQLHLAIELPFQNGKLIIASDKEIGIKNIFPALTEVANSLDLPKELRKYYLDTLIAIYNYLPRKPAGSFQSTRLNIAPEREGRILAEKMNWLLGNSLTPDFKRIPYENGLIVGISGFKINQSFEDCSIIDGAIASGATIISVIDSLKGKVSRFNIFSVHATFQGLYGLFRYADLLNIDITITVGHATNGLNHKYYANIEQDEKLMQVGDLGDTIADV